MQKMCLSFIEWADISVDHPLALQQGFVLVFCWILLQVIYFLTTHSCYLDINLIHVLSLLYLVKLNVVIFTFKKTNTLSENDNGKNKTNYFQVAIIFCQILFLWTKRLYKNKVSNESYFYFGFHSVEIIKTWSDRIWIEEDLWFWIHCITNIRNKS